MIHFLTTTSTGALMAVMAALLGWFGRAVLHRMDSIVGLPEAVEKLADAVKDLYAFRTDVDRRLTEHDRQLSGNHQRITILETKKVNS